MKCLVSVDVGGTKTRVSLRCLTTGKELRRHEFRTIGRSYVTAFNLTIDTIYRLAGTEFTPVCVGVGVAGMVEDGIIVGAGNLPAWVDQDYRGDLEARLNLPVVVMNDAEAAALGEYTVFGRPMFYVIWGTGVGGAVVREHGGAPVVYATEFGHITIDENSRLLCGCGQPGHLEALTSGANLPNQFDGRKAEELSYEEWSPVLNHMAVGIQSAAAMNPRLPVVLGGGVAFKQLKLGSRLPELQEKVDKLSSTYPVPKLYIAKHGEDSGLIGAAAAARRLIPA